MDTPDRATQIKALLAAALAFLTALWGWLGWMVLLLIVCMGLDWITGSWAARRRGEWSSARARDGLWHKLGEIVALLVAALCDIAVRVLLRSTGARLLQGWDYGDYMTLLVTVWYIFTELGSIVENAGALGAPVPAWLRKGIAALRQKADAGHGGSDSAHGHDSHDGDSKGHGDSHGGHDGDVHGDSDSDA